MKLSPVYSLSLAVGVAQALPEFPGSSSSWGSGRIDVVANNYGYLIHKYHASPEAGWNKGWEILSFASMDNDVSPSSLSWSENRLDIFAVGTGKLYHKFWDGSQWQPEDGAETLAEGINGTLAVTSWAVGRFDVVGRGSDKNYVHKYYDGSSWQPSKQSVESLGADGFGDEHFSSDPASVSWGENRLDIFGILTNGTLLHKYWDGTAWKPSDSSWEQWGDDFTGNPRATSWGKDRLDVWALRASGDQKGELAHRYWNGNSLSDIETLGGSFLNTPQVAHWGVNRVDIFGIANGTLAYKYWDGHQWNPSDNSQSWSSHGPSSGKLDLISEPTAVSWGSNSIHALVVNSNGNLNWQFWEGSQWLPKADDFYELSASTDITLLVDGNNAMKKSAQGHGLVVQDADKNWDL